MKLYNTLTKKVEEFIPFDKNEVTMYTCGPTVYNYAHIGNLRTYIFEDILEKSLKYLGYNVKRAMNITDVGHLSSDSDSGNDKMVASAKSEKKSVLQIADYYTNAFFEDLKKLNIEKPQIISKATENISEYIKVIEKLLKDDYAYISKGNIYFNTAKLNDYYQLTNHKENEMVVGVREGVEFDEGKKNQADFVLWFTKSKFDDQELKWDSPWGKGYPGWHIECSCIAMKQLGKHLDIHCGAVDNIFPHHTNEIAQSEAYLGHKWCNYWIHGEFLNDQSGKMAKSKGGFVTLQTIVDNQINPLAYRFMCLMTSYKKQLLFTIDALKKADEAYQKLKDKTVNLEDGLVNQKKYDEYQERFKECLNDDLNTPNALTVVYEVLKDNINEGTKKALITSFDKVLGLDLLKKDEPLENEEEILKLIELRNTAKKNKEYEIADKIRNDLLKEGIELIDTKEKTIYRKKGV